MKDKYDKAVDFLTEHPEEISRAWSSPDTHLAGCLFQYATPRGKENAGVCGVFCGCLTQVKSGMRPAWTSELTDLIRADDRIPRSIGEVTVKSLPVFAEWQRGIDKELGR